MSNFPTTCVIGGAGFIGRAVVAALVASGRQVLIVGRSAAPSDLPPGVRYLRNLPQEDTDVMQEALLASTEVIDLAYSTSPGTSFQDPVNDILANVPETVRLFKLAATMPHLRKFVWISSGGTVYGRTGESAVNEDHPTQPLSPYGITKLALEKYAHLYFETAKLPIVCIRPANAYGQGQRPYVGQGFVATAIASILERKELTLFGEYGTVRDYLHITDMAQGIVAALDAGQPGEIYNLGSSQGLTNRDILEMLEPLAATFGRLVQIRVLPARLFDVPFNVLDCSKLEAVSGWKPSVPITEGLAQTWNWYATQLKISK